MMRKHNPLWIYIFLSYPINYLVLAYLIPWLASNNVVSPMSVPLATYHLLLSPFTLPVELGIIIGGLLLSGAEYLLGR